MGNCCCQVQGWKMFSESQFHEKTEQLAELCDVVESSKTVQIFFFFVTCCFTGQEWTSVLLHTLVSAFRSMCLQMAVAVGSCRAVLGSPVAHFQIIHMTGPEEVNSNVFQSAVFIFLGDLYFLWEYYHTCISPETSLNLHEDTLTSITEGLLHPPLISPHLLHSSSKTLCSVFCTFLCPFSSGAFPPYPLCLHLKPNNSFNWELSWKTLWRFFFVLFCFFTCK